MASGRELFFVLALGRVMFYLGWGKTYQYLLYWTSPTDAPRKELSAGILYTTRAADVRSPYNF